MQQMNIVAVCTSDKKGIAKSEVDSITLIEDYGIQNDAHAGKWHRQVSLLSYDKVEQFKERGGIVENGAFGENILTQNVDLAQLPIGSILYNDELGIRLEVTQIGKECHSHCAIYHQVGDCIMPREGIFTRVLHGGILKNGDVLYVENKV